MPRPALALLLLAALGCGPGGERVVVYCAQDQEFAEPVFADFTARTKLTLAPKFDTEANKSVGLGVELVTEIDRPRCDVHWNNEPLGTIRLARRGVYAAYRPAGAAGYPPELSAADGTWHGFAARARVLLVNTTLLPHAKDRPTSVLDLTNPRYKAMVAVAKPQFGTTATHAACLFEVLGDDGAKAFFRALKANDVQLAAGNKQAATRVSAGQAAVGLTDTDDALIEVNLGRPVAIVVPDAAGHPAHPRLGTLVLPNTLALVANGPNPAAGRRLLDELLTPETESRLARAGGFQLPLHPAAAASSPAALAPVLAAKRMQVNWEAAADRWEPAQAFLREEFAR